MSDKLRIGMLIEFNEQQQTFQGRVVSFDAKTVAVWHEASGFLSIIGFKSGIVFVPIERVRIVETQA